MCEAKLCSSPLLIHLHSIAFSFLHSIYFQHFVLEHNLFFPPLSLEPNFTTVWSKRYKEERRKVTRERERLLLLRQSVFYLEDIIWRCLTTPRYLRANGFVFKLLIREEEKVARFWNNVCSLQFLFSTIPIKQKMVSSRRIQLLCLQGKENEPANRGSDKVASMSARIWIVCCYVKTIVGPSGAIKMYCTTTY